MVESKRKKDQLSGKRKLKYIQISMYLGGGGYNISGGVWFSDRFLLVGTVLCYGLVKTFFFCPVPVAY